MGFELTKEKPLFPPIEVKIYGKTYQAKPLNRETIRKIGELARAALDGDEEAAYKQLHVLFGQHAELDKLDIREVNAVLTYVQTQIFKPETADTKEKKAKGPGDKS